MNFDLAAVPSRRPGVKITLAAAAVSALLIGSFAAAIPTASAAAMKSVAPAARPMVALSSAPTSVGRLKPQNCSGTGTVSCDLWAKPGTIQVASTNIPIWGFAMTADAAATAPGPLLVVTQDDVVTITLHNGLNSNMSLALPGQHSVNGGGGDDRTGAAPGSSSSYTFTASHPGTFAYEAGHTADGARQVAMGAAGALVVLPSSAGTSTGNPSGYPDTSYDDDAPLVLSEIDPALNTSPDPATFDMRNYRPSYRLINGQAFPQTNTIATDQGHKVLLRYVNVGQQMHSMSVLGGSQTEVAQDGHPMKFPTTITTESIDPGTSLDTLVAMPGTSGATVDRTVATRIGIYEANGSLDNNAQITNTDPAQTAFGGMLTFLDTQAPVDVSTDNIGPKTTAISVSPSPSDALKDVTITATASDAGSGGSTVTAAEYVIDDDDVAGHVAGGQGVPMTVDPAAGVTTSVTGRIPASVLADPTFAAGKHLVYVRAMDAHNNWGVVGSVVLNVPKTGPATTGGSANPALTNGSAAIAVSATGDDSTAGGIITAAEYFVDNTKAVSGAGTPMTLNRSATVVSVDASIPATTVGGLTEGAHDVYIHVQDDLGLWGPLLDIPITVDKSGPATLATAVSPPATNGVTSDPSNPGYLKITTEIKDAGSVSNIVQAEAFIGTVKANGLGLQLRPIDGKLDSPDESMYALAPLSQVSTFKTDQNIPIYVHGKDAAGNWGSTADSPASLVLDRTAPVLTGLTASLAPVGTVGIALTSNLVEKNNLFAAEVWTGTKDPGVGKATPATIGNTANGKVTVYASFPGGNVGTIFHLRVRDQALNWSNTATGTTTASFADTLENIGPRFGWSAVSGTTTGASPSASITSAAKQPNPDETNSSKGFQANIAQGNNTRTGFVETDTAGSLTSYHARFQFQASTLSSGSNANNVVTVFDARDTTGANRGNEVFGVQFRGTGPTAQIRGVVGGTSGAWVSVGNGNHAIQLDWTNGTASSLVVSIDGNVADTVKPTTAVTAVIKAAQLGVSDPRIASTTTGKAWFDTYLSVGS
jgi:hypothetical protein